MDKDRRQFLKILIVGGGTLLAGKILSPLISLFSDVDKKPEDTPGASMGVDRQNPAKAFRVVEDAKILSIYDEAGEEIFQIDKSA